MKESFRVSRTNIILLCTLTLGLTLYAFSGIYLTMRRVQEARAEGQRLEDRLRVQEILSPAYAGLMRRLSEKDTSLSLARPTFTALSGDLLGNLWGIFADPARRAGVTLKDVLPDANAYDPRSGFLFVNLSVEGRPSDFHGFLVSLGEMPFVERFISIEVLSGGPVREMRVRVQVRMQPGGGRRS